MQLRKQLYLLREKSQRGMRTGGALLSVTLADRSGTVQGVFFDVPGHVTDALKAGQGVEVSGQVGEYRDQLQVKLERIVPAELVSMEEFLPVARRPLDQMDQEFQALLTGIQGADLARLLGAIFGDEAFYHAFTRSAAAKYNHHACLGGLLEHTLAVVRIVTAACELYPELDRDLALTVAILHDVGKVESYDPNSFELTEEGILWTHLYSGASRAEHAIASLPGFDPELRLRVVHAILAHHGSREAGSPVVPMTLEAIVLHYADNLDGDARGAIDHYDREGGDSVFTEKSFMHEARLFKGIAPDEPPAQPSLW
jgi:3'-5' exoribonuclease